MLSFIFIFRDALKLVLLFRYGGWYSDMDVVFLRSLTKIKNVLTAPKPQWGRSDFDYGGHLTGAILNVERGHKFLQTALRLFPQLFRPGAWQSSGADVLTSALDFTCANGKRIRPLDPRHHNRYNKSILESIMRIE